MSDAAEHQPTNMAFLINSNACLTALEKHMRFITLKHDRVMSEQHSGSLLK